jgi:type IV pilus assembly protein PilB
MNTGYRGRLGIYEVMTLSEEIKTMICRKETAMEIKKQAISEGMKTLREEGLEMAKKGLTTLEEILRETASI